MGISRPQQCVTAPPPCCLACYCSHTVTSFCCLCRPGARGAPLPARAILSMGGLSHGVIRVNTEDKNSALTVQDVGHIMPGGKPMRFAVISIAEYGRCYILLSIVTVSLFVLPLLLYTNIRRHLNTLDVNVLTLYVCFSSDVHCETRWASSALQDR